MSTAVSIPDEMPPISTARRSTGAIAAILLSLVPIGIAIYHDPFRLYTMTADMEIVCIREALRINEGLAQINIAHTGYAYYVLLAWWLKFLHLLDIVPISRLGELPSGAGFYDVYAILVYAGRWLQALLAGCCAFASYQAIRLYAPPIPAAWLGAIVATSLGLAVQAVIMRTELASALFAVCAFIFFMRAARADGRTIAWWMFGAGIAVMLSLEAKMQTIFVFAGLPAIFVLFGDGRPAPARGPQYPSMPSDRAALLLTVGLACAVPASVMALTSVISPRSIYPSGNGLHQGIFLLWCAVCWATYTVRHRVALSTAIGAAGALICGLSLGMIFHLYNADRSAVDALVNFADHMGLQSQTLDPHYEFSPVASLFVKAAVPVLRLRFLPSSFADIGPALIYWSCALAAAVAAVRGHFRAAMQAAALLGFALVLDMAFSLRGNHTRYLIYVEIWPILGLASVAPLLSEASRGIRVVCAGAAGIILAINLYAATRSEIVPRDRPDNACRQTEDSSPAIKIPFEIYCTS